MWTGAGPGGVRADATDCRAAVPAGTAAYIGEALSDTIPGVGAGAPGAASAAGDQPAAGGFPGLRAWPGIAASSSFV